MHAEQVEDAHVARLHQDLDALGGVDRLEELCGLRERGSGASARKLNPT